MNKLSLHIKFLINLIIVYNINLINGFSYNTNSKIVFTPKIKHSDQSYFGYTTLLRDGKEPKLIVGAPLDNSNYHSHHSIKNPGAIYTCSINLNKNNIKCSQRILDSTGNECYVGANGYGYCHKKDNMWLGMSMTGTTDNNGTVVMCAPRWINQIHEDHYSGNGLCYALPDTLSDDTLNAAKLLPLINSNYQDFNLRDPIHTYGKRAYYYEYGQAGISVAISDDNTEFLIGAPGILWTGSVIKYKIVHTEDYPYYSISSIPNPYYTTELTDASYLGYSVGFGKFISNKKDIYVAGAPRGSNYKGEVYVFAFPKHERERINIQARLEGKKIGEYFGSTIATIDINQDGLTDLIIGAPMNAETTGWDVGKVYVYINHDKGTFIEQDTAIHGSYQDGARFGTTISDIGDINGDGFIDVAIGAPYENRNSGAVYIYLGTANGLNPKYVQRITMDKMIGFGISISKGVDIDKNLCNDIAIGAHLSGNVVLLRCHPSVSVIPRMETTPSELSLNDTELTVQICIKFQGYSQYATELQVNVFADHVYKRVTFANNNDEQFQIAGRGGEESCKDILINIQPSKIDYSRPIDIKMSYELKHNPMNDESFCANCTVLRPTMTQDASIRVPIAAGCGNDLICRPDLKLNIVTLTELPFIIGSSPSLKFNISLENIGEPAFLTQIHILFPSKTPLSRLPSYCQLQESSLICDIDNPFQSNSQKTIGVEFSTTSLLNSDEMLTFNITATSGGVEITPEDNNMILNIPLKSVAVLDINSISAPNQYIYVNTEPEASKNISHTFEIFNLGPSPLNTVKFNYFIPLTYFDKKTDTYYNVMNVYEPKAFIDDQFMTCNLISGKYAENQNELQLFNINGEENLTENRYTTTSKSTTEDGDISQIYQDMIDKYISYLPWSNDVNIPVTSLNINCTDKEHVTCLILECMGALNKIKSNVANINFKMDVNITNMKTLLKDINYITISSYAMADSIFNLKYLYIGERTFNWARSYIIGSEPPTKAPIWIIILSIIIGIVALAILTYVLYKYGFFERKTKDKLELLKNEEPKDKSGALSAD